MSIAVETIQDKSLEATEPREHRLGFRGKLGLPVSLAKSANDHGLDIKATRFQNLYSINTANGKPVASVLPMLADKVDGLTRADLKEALSYLHQPLRHLSNKIADANYEEPDLEDVLDVDRDLKLRPEFIASTVSFAKDIDTTVAWRLQNTRKAVVSEEAEILHDNLYRAIGFISRGSVQEEELHNGGHGDYDDHDDGCEVVAEELETDEAKKNASETSGLLLEGFRFSRKYGQYRLALNENFVSGEFEGDAQQQLHVVLKDALKTADPDIKWDDKPDRIFLNAIQLERFCDAVYAHTQGPDADFEFSIEDVLREEISADDFENVDAKTEELQNSELLAKLSALTPDAQVTASRRMAELSTALTVLQSLVDNEDMQGIWKKYNVTGRFFNKKDDNPLASLSADFERMQRVIDRNVEQQRTGLADIEAIAAEFRDTLAGGREIIKILDSAINSSALEPDGADTTTLHLAHIDQMLANASLAPTTLPRSKMNEKAKEIAHYVGRHTGQEGIDPAEAIEDFVDDFGGEVVEFVKKNKVITTALGLSFYFAMSAAAGQGGDAAVAQDFSNGQTGILSAGGQGFGPDTDISELLGNTQTTRIEMSIDEMEREYGSQAIKVCHLHLPVKVPYFEHCLFSDQTVQQLQSGYELIKGPLSTVLDAPSDGVDLLAPRAEGAPPIYFVDNFKDSLRTTGDVWFVANGYQNLAHAPWAAVAGSMGYKLGAIPAMRKTSGLITPLIDGAYGLTADNKYLLLNIPSIAYGYSEQGLSGAVMAATLASFSAYGIRRTQSLGQRGLELLPNSLKSSLPNQVRHGFGASSNIIRLSDYSVKKAEELRSFQAEEGFMKTGTGLLVPVSSPLSTTRFSSGGDSLSAPSPVLPFHGTETHYNDKLVFEPLPEVRDTILSLKIGGKDTKLDLNAESYATLVKDLTEFVFLLEHAPEKLGVKEEEPEYDNEKDRLEAQRKQAELEAVKDRLKIKQDAASKPTDLEYDEQLKRSVYVALDALEDYAAGDVSSSSLQKRLQSQVDTILGAKIVHLANAGQELSKQQHKALSIKGHKLERLFSREAARRDDRDTLAQTLYNSGRIINHWPMMPISMPMSLGFKAASASATIGKMGIRNAWSAVRDDIVPAGQLGWNAVPPKVKGHIIGGGLAATAIAMRADMNPQFNQAIQDTLPVGGEALADGLQTYSGAAGHVAGATTATGLFMVYNFGEDHLIIHISMGYVCIMGGAGARVAVYPIQKAGQIAEVFAEELADITKGYGDIRQIGRGAKRELQQVQRLMRDVKNYDQDYLPSLSAA